MTIRSRWHTVFTLSISLLISLVLSIIESRVVKPTTFIVELAISYFSSVSLFFRYFGALSLGTLALILMCNIDWMLYMLYMWTLLISQYNTVPILNPVTSKWNLFLYGIDALMILTRSKVVRLGYIKMYLSLRRLNFTGVVVHCKGVHACESQWTVAV